VASKSPGPNGWYHKYGIYNSSGTNPEVRWKEVKVFHGPGTVPPASTDGGVATRDAAGPDVAPLADAAGAGSSAGSDAASASGGSGGAGGSDGGSAPAPDSARQPPRTATGGSGGGAPAGPTEPEPEPEPVRSKPSGSGCRVGGVSSEGVAGQALAVIVLLAALARQRRRARQ
jgi:hypothetical protein